MFPKHNFEANEFTLKNVLVVQLEQNVYWNCDSISKCT